MGQRRNSRRPPTIDDRRHESQAVAPADGIPVPLATAWRCYQVLAVCGLLLLAMALVFGQTVCQEFVNYDDGMYVYRNPPVARGLTAGGITWAFTHVHAGYWAPLTWLSLMLDCQLYGLNAGGHHLTNVLLHAATAVVLFLVLRRLTAAFWPSAMVAALFAVHPQHVESVAWVTERKDVLSGLFFMLTLGTYLDCVRRHFPLGRYLAMMVFFALGLMAKPMLVTLPLVLLLLDYWPLRRMSDGQTSDSRMSGSRRFNQTPPHCNGGEFVSGVSFSKTEFARCSSPWRLVLEKIPLLLLAAVFGMVTFWTQGQARMPNAVIPLGWRIANAVVGYVAYVGQFFYPLGLAAFYPYVKTNLPVWKVVAAVVVLVCISAGALACRRRCPYLLMGWLWYLGTLLPVIGLVQAGGQAMADRFAYVPQIGLCIALVWGAEDLCRSWPHRRGLCGVTSLLLLVALMGCAWRQTSFWRDSDTLWNHTLACTAQNDVAHGLLGLSLGDRKQIDGAMAHCQKAIKINPGCELGHLGLANALAERGRSDEAMAHYRQALAIQPDNAETCYNFGNTLAGCGRFEEAIAQYQKAVDINPNFAEARCNLGSACTRLNRLDEAIAQYQKALDIQPDYAKVCGNLGNVLVRLGRFGEALAQFRRAVELKPDDADAQNNLAWLLATCPVDSLRNGAAAIEHAQRANQLCGGRRADVLNTLAAAYAEAGRFSEALAAARKALELATQQNHRTWVDVLRTRIALYEAGKPFHQTSSTRHEPKTK